MDVAHFQTFAQQKGLTIPNLRTADSIPVDAISSAGEVLLSNDPDVTVTELSKSSSFGEIVLVDEANLFIPVLNGRLVLLAFRLV